LSSETGICNGFQALNAPRSGHKKAKRGRELETERAEENFGIVSKMQARNVDPAVVIDRKVSRRCRRAKGRIEKRVSTGTGQRTRTSALIRGRIKPAPGSKGAKRHAVYRMPCSSRACRLENELTDGSLGTIFHSPTPPHPLRYSRPALPNLRTRDLISRHHLL
jgi:hypothetical protein